MTSHSIGVKKLLFCFVIFGEVFLFFNFANAATTYTRLPAGAEITSPVSVSISYDSQEEICNWELENNSWAIGIFDGIGGDDRISEYVASTTLSNSLSNESLPIGYVAATVEVVCDITGNTGDLDGGFKIINSTSTAATQEDFFSYTYWAIRGMIILGVAFFTYKILK